MRMLKWLALCLALLCVLVDVTAAEHKQVGPDSSYRGRDFHDPNEAGVPLTLKLTTERTEQQGGFGAGGSYFSTSYGTFTQISDSPGANASSENSGSVTSETCIGDSCNQSQTHTSHPHEKRDHHHKRRGGK